MSPWLGFDKVGELLVRKLLSLWVRVNVVPSDLASLNIDPNRPVCYAMEIRSLANRLVLENECIRLEWPRPGQALKANGFDERQSFFAVRSRRSFLSRKPPASYPPTLSRIVEAGHSNPELQLQIVPVTIFWGRSPDKEGSALKSLFSDTWQVMGRVRKFFTILLHGRNVYMNISEPVPLRELVDEGVGHERTSRKLARVLRVHFRRQRQATIGPDLSHRRTMVGTILQSNDVQKAIAEEQKAQGISYEKAYRRARKYAYEIAADYSYPFIRVADRVLSWLWNKLYDGISLENQENLTDVARNCEIVYVPCHRSHIDYLLLSYVLYHMGYMTPHVAAGINLNLPLAGRIVRKGGGFFLRRQFRGNQLYRTVFRKYLSENLSKGVPIEYFIEGGRSRTGRLRQPRAGLLAMTVRSFLENPSRPIAFVPVYIGYEKLVEGRSYISELSGAPKRRERLGDLFRIFGLFKSEFGKVYVNFSEPLLLGDVLADHNPDWRGGEISADTRPAWLKSAVGDLANRIMVATNEAAVVTPVNLIAHALLPAPKRAMGEGDLVRQLEALTTLLDAAPYSGLVKIPVRDPNEIIKHGETLKTLTRQEHVLGDVLMLEEETAVLVTYFRNNVLHLFALPALIACCLSARGRLSASEIGSAVRHFYPYLRSELFLRWSPDELDRVTSELLAAMARAGFIEDDGNGGYRQPDAGTDGAAQLTRLAHGVLQSVKRYYLTIALLKRHGSGTMGQRDLENLCYLMAQRLSMVYEFSAPEFFDKTLFRNFLGVLIRENVIQESEQGLIEFGDALGRLDASASLVLGREIRHGVLEVIAG